MTFDGADVGKESELAHVGYVENKPVEPKFTKEIFEDDYARKEEDGERTDAMHEGEDTSGDGWGTWDDADNAQEVSYHLILTDIKDAVGVTVHDYLESGLTFKDDSVEILLIDGDTETTLVKDTDYTLTQETCSDLAYNEMGGCTFEVAFNDSVFTNITDEAYIVISYQALAQTGAEDYEDYKDAILNHSYMTYGDDGSGSGYIRRSEIVTTETDLFGFAVYKYDEADGANLALAGAEFVLERDSDEKYATFTADTSDGDNYYMISGWTDIEEEAGTLTSGSDGYIRIEGLDDDTYTLTETKAPDGYFILTESVTVTIDEDGNVTFDGAEVGKESGLPYVGLVKNQPVTPTFAKEIYEDDYSRKETDTEHGNYNENVTGDGWGTWDDADNAQEVLYRLTLTDIQDAVGVTVHDYLEDGLSFEPDTVVVTLVDDKETVLEKDTEYTVSQGYCSDPEGNTMDGCTFEVAFTDSVFEDISEDAYVVISYSALADTTAHDYSDYVDKIWNHSYMTYGNDTYIRRSDVKTTETDLFGFAVSKYAADGEETKALAGAEFVLKRDDGKYATFFARQDTNMDVPYYMVSGWTDDKETTDCTLISGSDGLIRLYGLDDDSYTLIETKAPVGYDIVDKKIAVTIDEEGTVTVNGDLSGSKEAVIGKEVNVENTLRLVDIDIEKVWNDGDNQDGERPEEITLRLYANGKPAVDENGDEITVIIKADANGNWKYTFKDLPEYENGEKITYTVIENTIADYTPDYSQKETEAETEDENDRITWTITNDHTPGQTSLYVYKLWTDGDNQDGVRPPQITVNLLADGEPAKDEEGTAITGVLSEENSWEYSFTGLAEYADGEPIEYTVEEIVPDGYESTVTCVEHSNVVIIDNTHTPDTVDVKGTKTWDDGDDRDVNRPDYITVRLWADGAEKAHVTVTEEDGWAWSFTDLPKYEAVTDGDGNVIDHQEIDYTITEDAVRADGYISEVDGYDVTNRYAPETVDLEGTKIWEDHDNTYKTRPDSIIVTLYADGSPALDEEGDPITVTVEPDDEGYWNWSFTGLPKYERRTDEKGQAYRQEIV